MNPEETKEMNKIEVETEFNILYEDNHIIVVQKPQMVACCPDESKDDNLLDQIKRYIKAAYNKPGNVYVGLVHRLDLTVLRVASWYMRRRVRLRRD